MCFFLTLHGFNFYFRLIWTFKKKKGGEPISDKYFALASNVDSKIAQMSALTTHYLPLRLMIWARRTIKGVKLI